MTSPTYYFHTDPLPVAFNDPLKFIFESRESILIFDMVEPGQMFISSYGELFQKEATRNYEAWQVSDSQGKPTGKLCNFQADEPVNRILPKMKKIEF